MISSGRKGWASSNKKAGHPLKHRSGRREDDLFFSFSYFLCSPNKAKVTLIQFAAGDTPASLVMTEKVVFP